jgi:hypothetical protein
MLATSTICHLAFRLGLLLIGLRNSRGYVCEPAAPELSPIRQSPIKGPGQLSPGGSSMNMKRTPSCAHSTEMKGYRIDKRQPYMIILLRFPCKSAQCTGLRVGRTRSRIHGLRIHTRQYASLRSKQAVAVVGDVVHRCCVGAERSEAFVPFFEERYRP